MSLPQITVLIGVGQLVFAALLFLRVDVRTFRRKTTSANISRTPKRKTTRDKIIAVLIAGGLAFSGYAFYRTLGQRASAGDITAAHLQRKEIAESLANHLQDRRHLLERYAKPPYPTQGDLNDWETNVHRFLKTPELGEPYVARFDSASGFEGIYPVELPTEDVARYVWLEQRMAALREFIKEFSTQ